VLVAVSLIALVATGAGIRQVYEAQKAMTLRRALYQEIQRNRALVQAKEVLQRKVWALRATPRISRIATEVLGMHFPRTDEMLVSTANGGEE
jgi:cell division protein FtsL